MKWFFLFFVSVMLACTDFVIDSQDGSFVNGRSLEFARELQSTIRVYPRSRSVSSDAPNQTQGLSWISKYGYLGVTVLGMDFSFEGMNEAGLSFGYLWLPNVTEYPQVSPVNMKKSLDFVDFCDWVLGNFETVAQVKEALNTVSIWGHSVPSLGVAPVHAAIHDAKGKNLVVEFVDGKMQVYDNPASVLTNAPPFPWQTANLQNYLNLSPQNPASITFRGMKLAPPGQGSGFLGLPADWSPPSRFVKTFNLLRFAKKVATGQDAVNLAEHLLNSVDIPMGEIRDSTQDETGDYTQWVVIKDMSQKVFYFRSYADLAMKRIDLKRINFSKTNYAQIPISLKKGYVDVTDFFDKKASMSCQNE